MLKISMAAREPIKVDLPDGASVTFKPAGSAGLLAAQTAYATLMRSGADEADALIAFSGAFAAWGVLGWEGISDQDGLPLDLPDDRAVRAELIDLLLTQDPLAFQRVDEAYVAPFLSREAEKNESALSPAGGTPAGAPATT
jgi:hypothetical protein